MLASPWTLVGMYLCLVAATALTAKDLNCTELRINFNTPTECNSSHCYRYVSRNNPRLTVFGCGSPPSNDTEISSICNSGDFCNIAKELHYAFNKSQSKQITCASGQQTSSHSSIICKTQCIAPDMMECAKQSAKSVGSLISCFGGCQEITMKRIAHKCSHANFCNDWKINSPTVAPPKLYTGEGQPSTFAIVFFVIVGIGLLLAILAINMFRHRSLDNYSIQSISPRFRRTGIAYPTTV